MSEPINHEKDSNLDNNPRSTPHQLQSEVSNPESLQQLSLRDTLAEAWSQASSFMEETKKGFVWDRKSATTILFCCLASLVGGVVASVLLFGGVALITSPLWLPFALLFSPLWVPLSLFTSPVWVTATATAVGCIVLGTLTLLGVVFFFIWPEEWLPPKEGNQVVSWYLSRRDSATVSLVGLQAKVLLYAAGAGPAADAAMIFVKRIDLEALMKKVGEVDWNDFGQKLQKMEWNEIQDVFGDLLKSVIRKPL